jgi:3-oxoacyl-[acyl-carrier protein] reductase
MSADIERVALVTGAAGQIGAAVVRRLVADGLRVCAADRDPPDVTTLWGDAAAGRILAMSVDVRDPASVLALVAGTLDRLGRIDVLVNVAGVVSFGSAATLDTAEWDRVMDINLRGTFLCAQAVIPAMQSQRHGRIVNIGSVVAKNGGNARPWISPDEQDRAANIAYGVSKAGVHVLTAFLAKELAAHGITVNCVAPGPVQWALTVNFPKHLLAPIPIGRMVGSDEIADAIAFLSDPRSGGITGEILDVNGGMWCD